MPSELNPDRSADLDAEEFRAHAHKMVDWIANLYGSDFSGYPVLSTSRPGELREALPEHPPEQAEDLATIFADFESKVMPGVTHWNHPGFMAYFGITGSAPGLLGELLAQALNVNGMLWRTSPACTELELHVLDWLLELLDLPRDWFGHLTDTASISTLLALVAAREATGLQIREKGLAGRDLPEMVTYASDQAHSSVAKAAITVGLGAANHRSVPHDGEYRMDIKALAEMITADKAAGKRPLMVSATVGTTSTTSVDPLQEIAEICRREGLWMHVDAAYAGSAAILESHRHHFRGAELADSFTFNPHKWLFTQIDCSVLYTRHPEVFRTAFSLVPEYLRAPVEGEKVDLMDYGVQLGRRFRALKLWYVIRAFGAEGLRERIARHIELADWLRLQVEASDDFELLAPVPFSVVCLRARVEGLAGEELDALNRQLIERVNASGEIYLSHTGLDPGIAIRVAIGNLRTTRKQVSRCWELLVECRRELVDALGCTETEMLGEP